MDPIFLHHDLLPAFDLPQDFFSIFLIKRFQRIETFSVFGKSYRYNRNALKDRRISGKLFEAVFQLVSVIDTLTQYDLSIHGDSCIVQHIHLIQSLSCKTVMQHFTPEFRIHCLERNVDRFQMIADHTLNILLTHIGKRNIISLKKGKPGIIILKIQRLTHTWRHLVNKTEHTLI